MEDRFFICAILLPEHEMNENEVLIVQIKKYVKSEQ